MPLPIDNLTTLQLDAGTDDPSQARVEILTAINKLKEIIAALPLYADGSQSATGPMRVSAGDNSAWTMGHNGFGKHLRVGSYSASLPAATGQVAISNGNIHIDAGEPVNQIFLNWFKGSGVIFGNGATNEVALIDNAGIGSFNNINYYSHPVAGYTKVGTGVYMSTNSISYTGMTFNSLVTIPAPAGARGLIVSIWFRIVGGNAGPASRFAQVPAYSNAGTIICSLAHLRTTEFIATTAMIAESHEELTCPVIGGNAYIRYAANDGVAAHFVGYAVIGYMV